MDGVGVAVYYIVAALAQWVLGLFLLLGRRRDDALFVMGVLFATNGSLAVLQLVVLQGGDQWGYAAQRALFLFDQLTNLCILYFALAYPRKIALLERKPWVVRGAFIVLGAAFAIATFAEPLLNAATYRAPGVKPDVWWLPIFNFFYMIVNAGVFGILVVRWSLILRRMEDVAALRQFRLIFAAFALRAYHLHLRSGWPQEFADTRRWLASWLSREYSWWDISFILNNAATLAAAVILVACLRNAPPARRSAALFVLAFAALGVLEGLLSREAYTQYLATRNVTNFLLVFGSVDYLFVRPIMVWLAMASHHFANVKWRSVRAAQAVVFVFAFPTFYGGFVEINGDAALGWLVALPAALIVSIGLAWSLRGPLRRMLDLVNEPEDADDGASYYTAVLQDLKRRGPLDEHDWHELERLAGHLGIPDERKTAIDHAVLAAPINKAAATIAAATPRG